MNRDANQLRRAIEGVLLGTAVGDAIGLPCEAMTARRAMRRFGGAPLRHRFVFGRGMMSDDTEHTLMAAQALIASRGEAGSFARELARRLRWWLLGVPAGIGFATLRACARLWLGVNPTRSGVNSAGNGAAMRAAILGVVARDDVHLADLVRAGTCVTHSDGRAFEGALAVALAARASARTGDSMHSRDAVLPEIRQHVRGDELLAAIDLAAGMLREGASVATFAAALGQRDGVGGYVNHTVPVALYAWLTHPGDFRAAVESVIVLGGDADTTGAIVGAIAGAGGVDRIPNDWLDGLLEWPNSVARMREIAARLAGSTANASSSVSPLRPRPFATLVRNAFFIAAVFVHVLRRLLPPY